MVRFQEVVLGQTISVREEYLIGVIEPGMLTPGSGKYIVIFVGGSAEVSRAEATRIAAIILATSPTTNLAALAAATS